MSETSAKKDIEIVSAEPEVCPYCGSKRLFFSYDRGEIACVDCGSVVSVNRLDRGPDWRAFTAEEKERRSRTGPPVKPSLVTPSATSATIDWSGKDAFGRKLSTKQRFDMIRLRKWHKVSISSSVERNLVQAVEELDRLASKIGLPQNVRDEAFLIYKTAINKGLVKGRSINSVVAAALYAACRRLKIPITLDEFAKYTEVSDRKDIARCYRFLIKDANIRVDIADPVDFIERLIHMLNIKPTVYPMAKDIIMKAKDRGLTAGKDPAGLAAAAVYIAATLQGEKITQKDVAKAANVTEVTVRNRFKELMSKLNITGLPEE
ncbi:MAG TPA: transcription initiation factor IIB [Geobacterales bacterium]|nr:transcription initiation factor IIB [Geobacterales bacterium]